MNEDKIVPAIAVIILAGICTLAWYTGNTTSEKSDKCLSIGGQPVTDRGVYKFCMKKEFVLEVK